MKIHVPPASAYLVFFRAYLEYAKYHATPATLVPVASACVILKKLVA